MPRGAITFEISGVKEFLHQWRDFPQRNMKQAFKRSLAKTATVLNKRIKRNASRLRHRNYSAAMKNAGFLRIPGSDSYARTLTRNGQQITVVYKPLGSTFITKAGISRRTGQPYVIIGPESRTAPHANLVEFGTAPHAIPTKNGATINHPGSRPQPFVRDAFISGRKEAESKLARELKKDITREIIKLARKADRQ